jgi:hypothetical protein
MGSEPERCCFDDWAAENVAEGRHRLVWHLAIYERA